MINLSQIRKFTFIPKWTAEHWKWKHKKILENMTAIWRQNGCQMSAKFENIVPLIYDAA